METEERERLVFLLCEKLINDEQTIIKKYDTQIWELINPNFFKDYGDFRSVTIALSGIKFADRSSSVLVRVSNKTAKKIFSLLEEKEVKWVDKILENFSKSLDEDVKDLCCNK